MQSVASLARDRWTEISYGKRVIVLLYLEKYADIIERMYREG